MSLITTSAVGTLTIDGREQEKKKHKSGPTGAHQRIEAFNDVPFFPGSRSMLGKTPGIQSYEYRVPVDLIRYANLSVLSLSSGDSFHDVLGHGSVGSFNDPAVVDLRARRFSIGTEGSMTKELSGMDEKNVAIAHECTPEEQALVEYLESIDRNLREVGVLDAAKAIRSTEEQLGIQTQLSKPAFLNHAGDIEQANLIRKYPSRISWARLALFIITMTFSLDIVVMLQADGREVSMPERGMCLVLGLIICLFLIIPRH